MNTLALEPPATTLAPPSPVPSVAPSASPTAALRIFGVGNAGVNILETLLHRGNAEAAFIAIGADAASLAASSAATKLSLETKRLRGVGTNGDPERGRAMAEENLAALNETCQGAEVVLIVTGLGGGAGAGISPVLARAAKDTGALVLACAVMPFDCEGSHRQRQAQTCLERLRALADGVVCLPNQQAVKQIDERTPLVDTYRAVNELLAEGLAGLVRLLTRRGLIPIHLNELCAVLRGRPAESLLANAEAHGPNRARDVVEKILAHPLLDGGRALAAAETVIVSLNGGADLSMADVNRVMEQINRQCEGARVLMGTTVDPVFAERLNVTLIATRREPGDAGRTESAENASRARSIAPVAEGTEFLQMTDAPTRSRTRLVPPAPDLPPQQMEQALARQNGTGSRGRKVTARMRQATLPLDVISRGRFDKTEPNFHRGEDLDTPTYLRRGCVLN
jgi:cell division protein FtsZ